MDSGVIEMFRRVHRRYSMEEMLSLMDPLLQEWFREKFERLTPPQAYSVPLIHRGKNVLVSSPTGSGKTITAFLSIINELYLLQKKERLEERIYCVYVSPLKALANDINRNLTIPLKELKELAEKKGVVPPAIRVAVRSGDTTTSERARMVRKPPHIFITTPESLSLILSTTRFSERFHGVRYIIVDEIHEIISSKRGVMLSLALERLEAMIARNVGEGDYRPPVRIGLSATQAPIEEIARFLGGYQKGRKPTDMPLKKEKLPEQDRFLRPMNIVEVKERKPLDLKVLSPVEDMNLLPFEVVNARMYDLLVELIHEHTTTLIFTNTRSATEAVVYRLKEKGIKDIAAHHGSLSRETRLGVESALKDGKLRVVVSSTSLELGIDIGYIDLVVQINSPKTVAKGLQRIGRAGHGVYDVSKGRIVVFDRDDLIESAVLTKFAYEGFIDRIHMLHNSLDVLAQALVGMSLEKSWKLEEAYDVVTRAYPYRTLSFSDFLEVLRYIGGGETADFMYSKVWFDEKTGTFGIKRGSRMIYNMNLGTIPQESSFKVILQQRAIPLGSLSEKFVEKLDKGDIFVLGGKTYEFIETDGMKVIVKNAHGRKPTVPSWAGEMLPRSYDLSLGVGQFRGRVAEMLNTGIDRGEIENILRKDYNLDRGSARTIINYLSEHLSVLPIVPTDRQIIIEGYIDESGRRNLIFHYPFGRRVNDALSRAYARVLSERLSSNVKISLTDDNFMLTFSRRWKVKDTAGLVKSQDLEKILRNSVRYTELFKQRFRHCANRGFMVLKNYLGREIPVGRQQFRTSRILEAIHGIEEHPIVRETYNEILHDVMDIDNAMEVLKGIESGRIKVYYEDYHEIPSPLAHNIVLMGISDIVLMEDRSALLRELHKKVLKTAFSEEEFRYRLSLVEEYFREKRPSVQGKEDLLRAIERLEPLNLFLEKGRNIYEYSDTERDVLKEWCISLVNSGAVESVWKEGELWALSRDVGDFEALYSVKEPLSEEEKEIVNSLPFHLIKEDTELLRKIAHKLHRRKDIMRKLQRAYLIKTLFVKKGNEWEQVYIRRRSRKSEYETALDRAIIRQLSLAGPSNSEELSYYLSLSEGTVEQALDDLVERGTVVSGAFVIGKLTPQYMLAEDVKKLDEIAKDGYEVFDEKRIGAYLHNKHIVDTIDDYLELFGSAPSARVVYQHTRNFRKSRWISLLRNELVQGRFVRHRVNFVRKEDVSLYAAVYRDTTSLEPIDHKVLSFIEQNPACTKREILNAIDAPIELLEESIERLDYTLNIVRIPEAKMGGVFGSINKYDIIDRYVGEPMDYEVARERIVMMALRAFGPTTLADLKRTTLFHTEEIEKVLSSHRDEVEKILVKGDVEMIMYLFREELEALKKFSGKPPGVEIYSKMDPSIRHLIPEIRSRFGEGWYSPVVCEMRPVGVVIHYRMSDVMDVREILLEDGFLHTHPAEIAQALNDFMKFYSETGIDVLRIRRMARNEIKAVDREVIHAFTKKGFKRIHSWLVSGDVVTHSFTHDEILSFIFYSQHLHRDSLFEDFISAVEELGGIRNNLELQLRMRNPVPLEMAARRFYLVCGLALPPYTLYMTEQQAGIYQRAKSVVITPEMEEILKVMDRKRHYKDIFVRTSLSPKEFKKALKELRDGLYVVKHPWNYYSRIRGAEMTKEMAREWVFRKAVNSIGIFTPERLYEYFRGAFTKGELRDHLRKMVEEGIVQKGFLSKDEESLYYMKKVEGREVRRHPFHQEFILSPQDRLFYYLSSEIKEKFRMGSCYVIFRGTEMTGAFRIRKQGHLIVIRDFVGGKEEKRIIHYWGSVNNFVIVWETGA